MDFSLWAFSGRPFARTLADARRAADRGLRGLWLADHLMANTPDDTSADDPISECWTALAAIAALVPRIELVSHVSPTTWHHPVVLRKRVIEVDQIAEGRAVLGLGAGWQVNEHAAYGIPLPPPGERVDRFEECIEVISRLRTGERITFDGKHIQLRDAIVSPIPRAALPLLVGTNGPRMLRITARFADRWNTWGLPDQVGPRSAALTDACEREGRDPGGIRRSAQALVRLTPDPAERDAFLEEHGGRGFAGSAEELIDAFGRYAEAGIDEFGIHTIAFSDDPDRRRDELDRFADEVLDRVATQAQR